MGKIIVKIFYNYYVSPIFVVINRNLSRLNKLFGNQMIQITNLKIMFISDLWNKKETLSRTNLFVMEEKFNKYDDQWNNHYDSMRKSVGSIPNKYKL